MEIFGNPSLNAKYFVTLRDELVSRNYPVEIITANRDEAINRLHLAVLADETRRREENNEDKFNEDTAKQFLQLWVDNNSKFVYDNFGNEGDNSVFILGILFAPNTCLAANTWLQFMYQADAAHLDFGKYTFYSAYGSTANANACPLAFGIMFGNEDGSGWKKFWKFAKGLNAELNQPHVTIITDQVKGSKGAISEVLPEVANFHCSWHRRNNIKKASSRM